MPWGRERVIKRLKVERDEENGCEQKLEKGKEVIIKERLARKFNEKESGQRHDT